MSEGIRKEGRLVVEMAFEIVDEERMRAFAGTDFGVDETGEPIVYDREFWDRGVHPIVPAMSIALALGLQSIEKELGVKVMPGAGIVRDEVDGHYAQTILPRMPTGNVRCTCCYGPGEALDLPPAE